MSDTTIYATPDPPALPGKGGTFIEPVFGNTIIQLTDATDGTAIGATYSSQFCLNSDSTYFLATIDGSWRTIAFNPTTYAPGAKTTINPQPQGWPRWDVTGTSPNTCYYMDTGSGETNRKIRIWNPATGTATTLKDFASVLRRPGVVTSSTSATQFVDSNFVSPVSDMTPHYEVGQKVIFTSGALNGQIQAITAYSTGGNFTTAAFTGTPAVGDTFAVYPAGFVTTFVTSVDAQFFVVGLSQFGGQDTGHVLYSWDRQSDTSRVFHYSAAQFGGQTRGWHQMQMDKTPGSRLVWTSITSYTELVINAETGAIVHDFGVALGHADTSIGGWFAHTGGSGTTNSKGSIQHISDPPTGYDFVVLPLKNGATDFLVGRHIGFGLDGTKAILSTFLTPLGLQEAIYTSFVADGPPIYRIDSLLTKMNSLQHPTPENLGEVWSTQTKLTYMGTTKASIVAAGQWAYDPTGNGGQGTLWVRAALDQDLSISANTRVVSVFDWRCLLDEIVICYIDEVPTGNAQKWRRLTKVYSRTSGPGASETSWTPRASLSPDGRFVIFCSTWGDRMRRDIFAVVMTPDTGIGQTFERTPQSSRSTMTESLRVPKN